MEMDELSKSIDCLCNSPQRYRILDILDDMQMDVRDLMTALDSPRSTVQRNLSVLEEQGWIKTTTSGYRVTTIGRLLCEEFVKVNETAAAITRMAPFWEAVDTPPEIDLGALSDALVTTPDQSDPNAPTKRLFNTFDDADHIHGFVPVISSFMIEHFHNMNRGEETIHEYVLSQTAFDALRKWYDGSVSEKMLPSQTEILVYEDDIPYGLFISDEQFVLTAYDDVGRMEALVETPNKIAIERGEQIYESYRRQSTELGEQTYYP